MGAEVGILRENRYVRDFLKHYHIPYMEFSTAQEMLVSKIPVLFCDTQMNLLQAVEAGKFVLTNHSVLMQMIGKTSVTEKGYYYVMKDFVFGERSFYINETVSICDPSVANITPVMQRFVKEQDFFDVGETFSKEDQKITGACILAGRQIISLPWNLSRFDRYKDIALRPQYHRRSNHHALRILSNADYKGFRQLLLALLRYAYRRQEIWMPASHAVNVKMGEQDIEFIYPSQKLIQKADKLTGFYSSLKAALPTVLLSVLLLGMLMFTSVPFAACLVVLVIGMCVAVLFCKKKMPNKMKYLLGAFAVLMIAGSMLYNLRSLPSIFSIYRADTQTRYQSAFLEKGEYVDAFLQLLAKGRTVQVHDTGDAYEHPIYTYYEEGDTQVKFAVAHDPKYYYGRDYYRFFAEFADQVTVDETLACKEDYDFSKLKSAASMTQLGYSNDMARYTFLINQDKIEQASYFWYDYVYREVSEPMYVYLEADLSPECETLVALWDTENNLYVMSRDYYDREVAGK